MPTRSMGWYYLVGCDKTTPALLMGAASCGVPTLALSGGPMLNGVYRGERIGSGTHVWKFDAMVKAGEITLWRTFSGPRRATRDLQDIA